ncbi:INO80 [Enterospora canceri]|uniref:Chromatin-remodeling ATPase INO80 n=1 Tax=Enterospora canceri TaxID=1081671 RepID=A0A1Y1S5W6_9MICR|nr:INO80 [Enterospora canceri]
MRKSEYEELKQLFNKHGQRIRRVDRSQSSISSQTRNTFSNNKILLSLEDYTDMFGTAEPETQGNKAMSSKALDDITAAGGYNQLQIIKVCSGSLKQFNQNYNTIIIQKRKLAAVCSRELKRSLSKTSKTNPMLKSKRINKELAQFDRKSKRTTETLLKLEERQAQAEKRRLEEIEEENRQKRKFTYLLNQTEAFAGYFLNRKTSNADLEGIKAAKRQMETTKEFDSAKKQKKENVTVEEDAEDAKAYVHVNVEQPKLLKATLKDYQLKGLNWLVNLYNQSINGILADDMGLGKTVQSIALLAYLYESKGIAGPFLVISPTTLLHNWADEFNNFLPDFKIVEYWGSIQERKDQRKKIKNCNVIITSYQLALADESYLKKIRFQYMILDEAQAIKNNTSLRWKSLLNFKTRNRLLLTGTPIQNTMTELWALLHFIMPTLFDSVTEFSEWFSKEIESKKIDEEQISRLHTILKPFMLRRHKNDVKDELGKKEIMIVYCDLSIRQQILYDEIINSRMDYENIMMHLKKVCNHPDLFEKLEPHSGLVFGLQNANGYVERRTVDKEILPNFLVIEETQQSKADEIRSYFRTKKDIQKEVEEKLFAKRLLDSMKSNKVMNEITTEIDQKRRFSEMLANRFVFRTEKCHLDFFSNTIDLDRKTNGLLSETHGTQINANDIIKTHPLNTFINDSGKLKVLNDLLAKLKKDGHRLLVYFQMTRMMDLFEEFLVEKQYSFLRLDGSSKISQRKTTVKEWQTNNSHFVFILSTRAGGVGLNLTAADTVIFYDSDWNPTVDQQAMDRVHRLGQTKDVTIYRLITRNTIEERIMEMADKKGEMQKLVIKEDVFRG